MGIRQTVERVLFGASAEEAVATQMKLAELIAKREVARQLKDSFAGSVDEEDTSTEPERD